MSRIKHFNLRKCLIFLFIPFFMLSIAACSGEREKGDKSVDPVPSPVDVIATVTVNAAPNHLNPGGTSEIKAVLQNGNGNAMAGETVSFDIITNDSGSNLASIIAVTDTNGEAHVLYTAGKKNKVTDTIQARAVSNGKIGTVDVKVDSDVAVVGSISVIAGTDEIIADGESQVLIRAKVLDIYGVPAFSKNVNFNTTAGKLSAASAVTDENGFAEVFLTSPTSRGKTTVRAETNGFIAAKTINCIAGPANHLYVEVAPETVYPNDSVQLIAAVEDANDNRLFDELLTITIRDAIGNVVETRSAQTEDDGVMRMSLTAIWGIGDFEITVSSTNEVTFTTKLTVGIDLDLVRPISMLIDASNRIIDATGSARSEIKVLLRDGNNNPIQNAEVKFSTNLGTVTASATTEADGYAYVNGGDYPTLTSDQRNGVATVYIWYGPQDEPFVDGAINVVFSGISLNISANPESLTIADATTIEATLRGPAGNRLPDQEIILETDHGKFKVINGGTIDGEGRVFTASTDSSGNVSVQLTSSSGGTARVTGWHAPTKDQPGETIDYQEILFSGVKLTLSPAKDWLVANGLDQMAIVLLMEDEDGVPVANQDILLNTTFGSVDRKVTTNAQGKATANLTAGTVVGEARLTGIVEFEGETVMAAAVVPFISGPVDSIKIIADPLIIRKDTGLSEIRAMVKDPEGNPVEGVIVGFTIIAGPGGGEIITPSTVRTRGAESEFPGQAVARFQAGNLSSADSDDVRIEANAGGFSDFITLTITGNVANIALGADTQLSAIIDNNDGTFSIPAAAILSDNKGIAMPAGIEVAFSIGHPDYASVVSPKTTDANGRATTLITYPGSKAHSQIILEASSGGIKQDISIRLPGADDPSVNRVEITEIPSSTLGDGISSAKIEASAFDVTGSPVLFPGIVFESNRDENFEGGGVGVFYNNSYLSGGRHDVDFVADSWNNETADPNAGFKSKDYDAYVRARSGNITSEPKIINVKGITLTVSPSSYTLLANGTSTTTVEAFLKETTTGRPITGKELIFGVTNGVIQGSSLTDGSGTVRVTFTSIASDVEKTASVRCYFGPDIMASTQIELIPFDSATVTILASTDKNRLDNDPNQTATITAQVLRPDGTPVTDGQSVKFEIISGLGQVDAHSTTLNGIATATFRATPEIGKSIIRVSSGGQSTTIEIEVGGTASSIVIGLLSLTASNTEIVADGVSSAAMRATVIDIDGNPVVGREVEFSTSYGFLSSTISTTNSTGTAEVILTSETRTGLALVMASIPTDAFSDQAQVRFVPGPPVNEYSSITVQPSTIPADGISTAEVTVTLSDAQGNPLANGKEVKLYAEHGTIITNNPAFTVSGRARFSIQAPLSTGVAELTLWDYPDVDAASLRFGTITSGDPSSILIESVSHTEVTVTGVGKGDNAAISVRIVDETGTKVVKPNLSLQVSLLARPDGGEFISGEDSSGVLVSDHAEIEIGAASGEVTYNLRSGFLPGVVEFKIEVLESGEPLSPRVVTVGPQISIASGPPHTMSLSAPKLNAIVNLNDGGDSGIPQTPGFYSRKAGLIVTDRYGNAVPDGTTINLGVIDSIISTGLGDTTEESDILEDNSANFQNDEIVRDNLPRRIEPNDRVVLFDVVARDKSRFVKQGGIGIQNLQVNKAYFEENNNVIYYVGASLLGGVIYGIDEDGATKGTVQTDNGLAQIRLVYPANKNKILLGCYVDPTKDVRHGQIPGFAFSSAQVITIFSSSDDRVSMVDKETLCFSGIAPASLKAVPEEASLELGMATTITLTLTDGGDEIPLPFIPITATVLRDGANVDVLIGETNEDGQFESEIELTDGGPGGSATITFYGLGATVEVEVEVLP